MLDTIVNHTDDDTRTVVGVPDAHYSSIFASLTAGLPGVVEMPLVVEVWVIRLESS